jgi:hypothetical protein
MKSREIFTPDFLEALRFLVNQHHLLYPRIPPRDIFFESLVERAFKNVRTPFERVERTARNAPKYDLIVGNVRISVKSETGENTRRDFINMTKLCTTERDPWEAGTLVGRVLEHLAGYDLILMLRAVWNAPIISYQLVEIPVGVLKLVRNASFIEKGKRPGRKSLGADVLGEQGQVIFHVHFDGSDGKCQIRNLPVAACGLLKTWEFRAVE